MEGYMDHHSWLVDSNLLTDQMKDNIATAAYLLVEGVIDSSTTIDFNEKQVGYKLLLSSDLYDNLKLLERFNNGENIGFFESLRLKKFIQKKKTNDESGMGYKLDQIGTKFVRAYLNNDWNVQVEIFKESKNEGEDYWLYNQEDK